MTSDICAKLLQSCPTLCDPMDYSLPGSSVHGIFPGKNMGVDCYFLLQGIVLTQGSNPSLLSLLHWQAGSLPLAPPGKPLRGLVKHLPAMQDTQVQSLVREDTLEKEMATNFSTLAWKIPLT